MTDTLADPYGAHRMSYYRRLALAVGVPSMWVDDAVSEAMIAVWQAPQSPAWKQVAKHRMIDFVRTYGPRTRQGNSRTAASLTELVYTLGPLGAGEQAEIEHRQLEYDPWPVVDDVLDMRDAIRRLLPQHRDAIAHAVWRDWRRAGDVATASDEQLCKVARRSLRAVRDGRRPFRYVWQEQEAA